MRGTAEAFNLGRPISINVGRKAEVRVKPNELAEIVADHFLNWVTRSYRSDRGIDPDRIPEFNTNTRKPLDARNPERIAAYWKGGYFLNNDNKRVQSYGINFWATAARRDAAIGLAVFQNL